MTDREKAIKEIEILKEDYWDDDGYGHETKQYDDTMLALDMAIKALEQEPCEDAISRQAVLDLANTIETDDYSGNEIVDVVEVEDIKQLPPVTPAEKPNKWIPVSERLPELNRPLLVTTYHRVYYGHLISESGNYGYPVFRIHGLGDKNRDWVQETMSHEPYSLGRIDAWMYLDIPEPYKEG